MIFTPIVCSWCRNLNFFAGNVSSTAANLYAALAADALEDEPLEELQQQQPQQPLLLASTPSRQILVAAGGQLTQRVVVGGQHYVVAQPQTALVQVILLIFIKMTNTVFEAFVLKESWNLQTAIYLEGIYKWQFVDCQLIKLSECYVARGFAVRLAHA